MSDTEKSLHKKFRLPILYGVLVIILFVLSIIPLVIAADTGSSITPDIRTEKFAPLVWMCDSRAVLDDKVEPGTTSGDKLIERQQNYAFEGESIQWGVLVMDKNGINNVQDVFATVGSVQGSGNDIEVNCVQDDTSRIFDSCNARIGGEKITTFDFSIMKYYTCTLTIETGESMYGEYWITVEATDLDDLSGTMDENEYWFLNPIIALTIDGDLTFNNVRPGTTAYSDTILVGNDADRGSGVRLQMFISGTNFYDSSSSGAMCPTSNVLSLNNFRYFATNGYYSTKGNLGADSEGYVGIPAGNRITQAKEIIGGNTYGPTIGVSNGDTLTSGSEIALTFKLSLPEPCNGDFDSGSIYFWGEAI